MPRENPALGLLYGDAGQFAAQLIGVTVNVVVVFGLAVVFLDRNSFAHETMLSTLPGASAKP